jgi:hypothetical protein
MLHPATSPRRSLHFSQHGEAATKSSSSFVVVLVLETVGRLVRRYLFPAPGGEPLWRVPDDLANIRSSAPSVQEMLQQAAPANHPARCVYPRLSIRVDPPRRAASRWVVPGSRLLPHVSAGFVIERIREGDEARAKAAPLQALGDYTR